MKQLQSAIWLLSTIFLISSLYSVSSTYAQETETEEDAIPAQETELEKMSASAQETELKEEDAVPVESKPVIELEREVHFLTPTGEDAVVSSGMYSVEAAEGGLRLTPSEEGEDKAVIIQAEATTHEDSVESSQLVSMAGEGDQHVVMLLLPHGNAMQAVGSYSGVTGRGLKKKKGRPSYKGKQIVLRPKLKSLLAVPPNHPGRLIPPGHATPFGFLYLKGQNFGTAKGTVTLLVHTPVPKNFWLPKGTLTLPGTTAGTKRIQLKVMSWKADKISVWIQPMKGVPDHSAVVEVFTDARKRSNGRTVPFYALRGGKPSTLKFEEAVTSYLCSTDSDVWACLTRWGAEIGENCFFGGPSSSVRKDKTISGWHGNCDGIIPDSGTDRYTIKLKKGWVIYAMRSGIARNSKSSYTGVGKSETLSKKYKGHSSITLKVPWKAGAGFGKAVSYWIDIDVTGPMGVPY